MIDNSISILGQVISIILGMFSTYIVLNFMHNFKRNVFYKKYVYIIVYIVFTLLIFLSSMYFYWCNENVNQCLANYNCWTSIFQ